ncbi:DUF3710 domain-containing protein [Rhodococcus jostii]|uniref:DUF3710 domain-containing protein n=1 Tax=Rhodococcus jostii TaxID=132919 RepID=UPI003628B412
MSPEAGDAAGERNLGEATVVDTSGEVVTVPPGGPVDVEDLESGADPAVGVIGPRVDLGSLLVPIPEGVQLQVQMSEDSVPEAVHLLTDDPGRITVEAYAAPRTPGQWAQVVDTLTESLRADGADVSVEDGRWGPEVVAAISGTDLRFLGGDGPRWMVRCVIASPPGGVAAQSSLVEIARTILADTVINRGVEPYPVGVLLPVVLPSVITEQLADAHRQHRAATQQQARASPST